MAAIDPPAPGYKLLPAALGGIVPQRAVVHSYGHYEIFMPSFRASGLGFWWRQETGLEGLSVCSAPTGFMP